MKEIKVASELYDRIKKGIQVALIVPMDKGLMPSDDVILVDAQKQRANIKTISFIERVSGIYVLHFGECVPCFDVEKEPPLYEYTE